jgi:hypothetical protein
VPQVSAFAAKGETMHGIREQLRLRRRALVVVGVVALAGIVGGVAWAAIPSGGVIDGCYRKSDGALRVIDRSKTSCKRTERAIQWNASSKPSAAFSEWNGAGGTNYIRLFPGQDTVIHSIDLPANLADSDEEVVAITTVWITNWGTPVDAGCTVGSLEGRPYGWPFTLQHGFDVITFQGAAGVGDGTLRVSCTLDGTPSGQVWAEVAAITVLPGVAIAG